MKDQREEGPSSSLKSSTLDSQILTRVSVNDFKGVSGKEKHDNGQTANVS